MMTILKWAGHTLLSVFKTQQQLLFGNLLLRQQLAVLNRSLKEPYGQKTYAASWA
ncbi:MAG: hypothetical protein KC643_03020 [Nitrospira sp.]|nr:hypothetical protein [Nitrospira sp.]MDR4483988.1 hypothetical protein [Nitrospirales bacterium]